MVALDEDALICDLAETYGVYNFRALPLQTAATLGFGLSLDSRIKQKQMGIAVPFWQFLLAQTCDAINTLCWMNSEDGAKNRNRPESIAAGLKLKTEEPNNGQFASADAFEAARRGLLLNSPKEGDEIA